MAELHQVARLYINFFHPSFKLKSKTRVGAKVIKKYHLPATPCEQLLADDRVEAPVKEALRQKLAALDPVQLLNQLREAQRTIANLEAGASSKEANEPNIHLDQFVQSLATAWRNGEIRATHRKRRVETKPHTWRTRIDPFAEVWPLIQKWLNEEPNATAKDLFLRVNTQVPTPFKPSQLRTLQRRVKEWRTAIARRLVLGCNYPLEYNSMPIGVDARIGSGD